MAACSTAWAAFRSGGDLLDRPVERAPGRKERRVRLERGGVQPPAEPVLERHAQLGLPLALRVEVRRVHLVRRELRLRVGLEEVELVRERIVDLRRELPPVVAAERAGPVEDLAEGGRRHVAAEIDAVEAEAARDRDVLGRQLDEEGSALVRARAVALGEREQLVGDDDSGDLSLRGRRAPPVATGDRRSRAPTSGSSSRLIQRSSSSSLRVFQPIWLMTKRAPASTFFRSLKYCGITSRSRRLWFVTTQPRKKFVRSSRNLAALVRPVGPSFISEKRLSSPTESMSNTGAASPLCPVTG